MEFDELDKLMRVYETAHDHCVLPGLFMVARLDGRGFTRLTKELCDFERPFDPRFRELMADTVEALMTQSGLRVVFGYTQSDEVSLLLHQEERSFGRKLRKLNSTLAGLASARFSLSLGKLACFDCRISQLPSVDLVTQYFRWRAEDAHRNALSAHCYWSARKQGMSAKQANAAVESLDTSAKNEFLFQRGVNFNDLPAWQRRGFGLHWQSYEKQGVDPRDASPRTATRRRLVHELNLPVKQAYAEWLSELVAATKLE